MPRPLFFLALLALVVLTGSGFWVTRSAARSGTPESGSGAIGALSLILVEHNDHTTTLDLGEPGTGAGDPRVWGPNPLFDEANATDTGATTRGSCVALNAALQCVLAETIVFPDGSTLEFQGVEMDGATPSLRTIVGGSGRYLGAIGTAAVAPSDDFTLWTRTIEAIVP